VGDDDMQLGGQVGQMGLQGLDVADAGADEEGLAAAAAFAEGRVADEGGVPWEDEGLGVRPSGSRGGRGWHGGLQGRGFG